jgi:hypothetical protein
MKTLYLKGLGDVPVVDEAGWITISWFNSKYYDETCPPSFDPSEKDLTDYEYRILKNDTTMIQLQRRLKNA